MCLSCEGTEIYGLNTGFEEEASRSLSGHGLEATFPSAGWMWMAHRCLSAWTLLRQAERTDRAGTWGAQACPITKDQAFLGIKQSSVF